MHINKNPKRNISFFMKGCLWISAYTAIDASHTCALQNKSYVHLLMNRKYKFHDNDKIYFISFARVYWIDVFIREEYFSVMIDSWKHCQEKKGMQIYGWCIMLSHVHMIIGSKKDKFEDIVRDIKKHTSMILKTTIKNNNHESRKEWMMWLMERAGKKNSNNKDWSRNFGSSSTISQ